MTGSPVDSNWWTGDALSEFLRQYGLLMSQGGQNMFAPTALPELPPAPSLPNFEEIEVAPKKVSIIPKILRGATELLGAPLLLIMDSPSDYGLPWPGSPPPMPPGGAPVGEDPIQPPNWMDGIREFDFGNPKPPFPAPSDDDQVIDLPEFIVSPPAVSPRNPFEVIPSGPIVFPDLYGSPGLGFEPAPIGTPGGNPDPGTASPDPDTRRRPVSQPTGDPAPDLFGTPLGDPITDPLGDPLATPSRPTTPGGSPASPGTPTRPAPLEPENIGDFFVPFAPPQIDPVLVQFGPEPTKPDDETCGCAKPKKRKPPSDRTVCYKGSYTQRKRGITFVPKEEVPCEKKSTSTTTRTSPPSTPSGNTRGTAPGSKRRSARKRQPTLGDLARDVFGSGLFGSIYRP